MSDVSWMFLPLGGGNNPEMQPEKLNDPGHHGCQDRLGFTSITVVNVQIQSTVLPIHPNDVLPQANPDCEATASSHDGIPHGRRRGREGGMTKPRPPTNINTPRGDRRDDEAEIVPTTPWRYPSEES